LLRGLRLPGQPKPNRFEFTQDLSNFQIARFMGQSCLVGS